MAFVRVHNTLIDPAKIEAVYQDENDINQVTVIFDSGEKLVFRGPEAMELWRHLDDDKGWNTGQ